MSDDDPYAGRHLAADDPVRFLGAVLERALLELESAARRPDEAARYGYSSDGVAEAVGSVLSDLGQYRGDRRTLAHLFDRQPWFELIEQGSTAVRDAWQRDHPDQAPLRLPADAEQ